MNVLILGMSDIASRRFIPALRSTPPIVHIDVASRHAGPAIAGIRNVYSDYATALERSDAELVYVSLVNSLHYEWARRSLLAGRHTVVDKPACLQHEETLELLDLAERSSLCVAEGTVFLHHPQFLLLDQARHSHGSLTRVSATFSFPPFPDGNFRNRRELGGGALADLGPYVAGLARFHFSAPPRHCTCRILSRHPTTGAETAFATDLAFGDGESLIGHFGFDTQYQNRISGYGPTWAYQLNRAFTTPPDMKNELSLTVAGKMQTVEVPPEDAFARFCAALISGIHNRNWRRFSSDMFADSALRDKLQKAADSGEAR